ncbi:MAG: fumarylacetoacetate hydrolase, partial [Candidatus Puniceispirillaceae bacterium]
MTILPVDHETSTLIGRVWRNDIGPCVVTVRKGQLFDIASAEAPTVADILNRDDAADYVCSASGEAI